MALGWALMPIHPDERALIPGQRVRPRNATSADHIGKVLRLVRPDGVCVRWSWDGGKTWPDVLTWRVSAVDGRSTDNAEG